MLNRTLCFEVRSRNLIQRVGLHCSVLMAAALFSSNPLVAQAEWSMCAVNWDSEGKLTIGLTTIPSADSGFSEFLPATGAVDDPDAAFEPRGPDVPEGARLAHVATDGESYGHHHRFGEMALAYGLDHLDAHEAVRLTGYASYLSAHPPDHEVEIERRIGLPAAI